MTFFLIFVPSSSSHHFSPFLIYTRTLCPVSAGGVNAQQQTQILPLKNAVAAPGFLKAGATKIFSVDARNCEGFLHVESWDLRRLQGGGLSKLMNPVDT